jgi:hypothetical protein
MTKTVRTLVPMRKDSKMSPWMKAFDLITMKIHERVVVEELWWC